MVGCLERRKGYSKIQPLYSNEFLRHMSPFTFSSTFFYFWFLQSTLSCFLMHFTVFAAFSNPPANDFNFISARTCYLFFHFLACLIFHWLPFILPDACSSLAAHLSSFLFQFCSIIMVSRIVIALCPFFSLILECIASALRLTSNYIWV